MSIRREVEEFLRDFLFKLEFWGLLKALYRIHYTTNRTCGCSERR